LNGAGEHADTTFFFVKNSDEETVRLGEALGAVLRGGDVIFAEGHLGAGKTCLIRGICAGLGFGGKVRSPSFAVVNKYVGRRTVYHMDLYRIPESSPELEDLSRQEYFSDDAVTLIEWGEKLRGWGVTPSARVNITPGDGDVRHIEMTVYDPDLAARLEGRS
jgi:tRNA threonylcarbamoyladenosine biosynthesis protein TsaE